MLAGGVLVVAMAVWLFPRPPSPPVAISRPSRASTATAQAEPATKNVSPQRSDVPPLPDRQQVLKRIAGLFAKSLRNDGGVGLTQLTDDELLVSLQDESLPLKMRRRLAQELARRTSDTAWAALTMLARNATAGLRAIVAEALGHSSRPEAKGLLLALLGDDELAVVQGAIRGLGVLGDADAISALTALLTEPACAPAARTAAALALGEMKSTAATASLVEALRQMDDSDMQEAVLVALGRQPFSATESFFRAYLAAPDTEPSLRLAALESVAGADGAVAPFLLGFTRDSDPQVRAAAVWGLTMAEPQDGAGGELVRLLADERDTEVRTRLYQALVIQEGFDFAAVMPAIERESDPDTRLAGFNLWASQCADDGQGAVAARFDQIAVPQLQQASLEGADRNEELTAVIALRRAGTAAAETALQQIARQASEPQVVEAAQSALAAFNRRRTPPAPSAGSK